MSYRLDLFCCLNFQVVLYNLLLLVAGGMPNWLTGVKQVSMKEQTPLQLKLPLGELDLLWTAFWSVVKRHKGMVSQCKIKPGCETQQLWASTFNWKNHSCCFLRGREDCNFDGKVFHTTLCLYIVCRVFTFYLKSWQLVQFELEDHKRILIGDSWPRLLKWF